MAEVTGFERLLLLQDEIIGFTWDQVGDKVDDRYVQGKVSEDKPGRVISCEGNLTYIIVGDRVLYSTQVITKEEFDENSDFVRPRIHLLHNLLVELQGKSPVRFRWGVDTKTHQVEVEWTYYDDLTDQEKEDNFWESWQGDFAWEEQLKAELAGK